MRGNTPKQFGERPGSATGIRRSSIGGTALRSSVGSAGRASIGPSAIPRGTSRISTMRASTTQPSYDLLTGAESNNDRGRSASQPLRESMRQSTARKVSDNAENVADKVHDHIRDELKAEIKTLKYTLSTMEQERELATLRHESELRDARRKAEEDFSKMQTADGERLKAVRQHEALVKETNSIRDAAINEKAALERKLREVEEKRRLAEEEAEDARAEKEESIRSLERKMGELEARNATLQRTVEEAQQSATGNENLLQAAQQSLTQKDAEIGNLESEVLRLKAQAGDADTLGIIKRELSEQVGTIRTLEAKNREQLAELKHLRRLNKSVEVVEEEKRELQRKVDRIEDLERELGEAQIQRQRLEDERLEWTAYLKNHMADNGQPEFDSPEAMAQALAQERVENASLVEKLGSLQATIIEKDSIIEDLEKQKSSLTLELDQLKAGGGTDMKARSRLERQRALAVKEVEYLRAQLQTFDAEETMQGKNFDEQKAQRIQQLEELVDKYRTEAQTLHDDLSAVESSPGAGAKRPRDESEDHEQLGQLLRKNRKLQDDLSTLQKTNKLLQKELSVTQEKLKSASRNRETRILSLRSNPTADFEAIKRSTLEALRRENADLLAQLQTGKSSVKTVPMSALEAAQRDTRDVQQLLESERKTNDRLKKVWLAKSQEFRELVVSLLGWDVVFMPNGKMRVTSFFYPSTEDNENSIVFDGDKGTMKVSGGPQSQFAMKIMDQIKFWVKERASIPCLLAALTLEFYEESTRATKQ